MQITSNLSKLAARGRERPLLDESAQLAECRVDGSRDLGGGRALAPPAGHVQQHAVGLEQIAAAHWHTRQGSLV